MKRDASFRPIIIDHLIGLYEYGIVGVFMLRTCWTNWKDGSWQYDSGEGGKFVGNKANRQTLREMLSVFYGR